MSERIFSGKSSQKFWDAVNKYKDDILYEYGCKAQEIEQQRDDLLAACEYSHTLILRIIGQATHAVSLLEDAIDKAHSVTPKAKGKI